jgi:hypothetical protein
MEESINHTTSNFHAHFQFLAAEFRIIHDNAKNQFFIPDRALGDHIYHLREHRSLGFNSTTSLRHKRQSSTRAPKNELRFEIHGQATPIHSRSKRDR